MTSFKRNQNVTHQ